MKRNFRGFKRTAVQLDFNLYRVNVPIRDLESANLSVIDIHPDGAEQTYLLVHGYAGVAETWEHQINHFMREARVVAPDLRGHGQSDAPFTEYTMAELVQDLDTIANELELPDRFILAGHSFGGSICIEYAIAHPDRLEKLILLSTAGEYPVPRIVSWASRIPTAAFRPWWRYRPRWNAEIHVMKRMMLNNVRKWIGWEKLEQISAPTLVITGARDRYFPRKVFEGVAERIPGAETIDIGGSKHKVQLERHQAVNRAMARFAGETAEKRLSWRAQAPSSSVNRPWLQSYGSHTPRSFPIPKQPMHRFLQATADWLPHRTATVFYGAKLTYQQLDQRANQFAHALHGLGIQPGDRVMIVMPNMPQLIVAFYGVLKVGGVVVLSNPDADAALIEQQLKLTEAKALVTLKEFADLARQVSDQMSTKVILADIKSSVTPGVYRALMSRWEQAGLGKEISAEERSSKLLMMDELMMDAAREAPDVHVSSDDLAAILFTSGTTDRPKGVCLSHSNLVANALQTRHWLPDLRTGQETFLSVIPLTHSYGMTVAMNIPIALGATMVLLSVFELQQVLEAIKTHRPTIFPGVPSIYAAINNAKGVRSYGLSSIKACISGAAPLPVEVQEKFEKLTHGRVVEGYGLTEASPTTHANPFEKNEKIGSIGIPIPNTDAKIIDLITEQDLPPGQVGELLVKGPQVMQGYWSGSEADENERAIKEGWLRTGDVAVMDEEGFFYIISRKRDTIMASEYSVYPRDVEEVLYESNKVMEAAVVGVTAEDGGQRVKAFVVPRPGTNLTKEELLELCRKRLEEYAVPWEIEFREELPKSFIGKVLRRMLIEDQK
jgi:long-chain acyl-CoA synthetase